MKSSNTKMSPWVLCLLLMAISIFYGYAKNPTPPPPSCPLAPPTSVVATDVGTNSLNATWTAVPNAQLYKITVKNLNTNLIIATVYSSTTSKFINGLPANTPLRIGVSASRCNAQIPSNFGAEKTTDVRTLKYIVVDDIVGKFQLYSSPWSVTGQPIPVNSSSAQTWSYYQAKVTGQKNGGGWSCRFSIVTTCLDNLAGAGFYIFVDTEETQNVTYIINQPLEAVEFKCQGVTLFSVQLANLSSSANASTNILFPPPSGGVSINSFETNKDNIPNSTGPIPAGFNCVNGGGDGLSGTGNEDRRMPTVSSDHTASLVPNPTSDRTDLRFHLSASSEVTVHLLDPAGRSIQQIVSASPLPEGPNQMSLDLSTLPPGFYFVQLRSVQGQETMTLVKQ